MDGHASDDFGDEEESDYEHGMDSDCDSLYSYLEDMSDYEDSSDDSEDDDVDVEAIRARYIQRGFKARLSKLIPKS